VVRTAASSAAEATGRSRGHVDWSQVKCRNGVSFAVIALYTYVHVELVRSLFESVRSNALHKCVYKVCGSGLPCGT